MIGAVRLSSLLCGALALVGCVEDPNLAFDMMVADGSDAASLDLDDASTPADGGFPDQGPPLFVETNQGLSSGYFVGVAAAANGTVYAASYYRVFASKNGGANWTLLAPERSALSLWTAIALHRANPQHVVLGDESGRVLRSLDGGASFSEIVGTGTLPRPTSAVTQLAYLADDTIIAMGHDRMYRWNGTQWNDQTGDFLIGSLFTELALDDSSPPRAYVASDQQILSYDVATDEWTPLLGESARSVGAWGMGAARIWGYVDDTGVINLEIPVSPVNPLGCGRPTDNFFGYGLQILDARIFATDGGVVAYRDRDCVAEWAHATLAPFRVDATPATSALTVAQTEDHETIYLGTNQGVLQSATLGDPGVWIDRTEGLRAAEVWSIASASTVPTLLFAATERGLYESSNAGSTWQPVATTGTTILPKNVGILQVEVGQERVLLRTVDQRIFFSDDRLTWTELDATHRTTTFSIAIERTDKTVMYRCSELGVERMVTSLGLWQRQYSFPDDGPASCISMLVHPASPTHVYAIDDENKLWRSSDRGVTFVSDDTGGAFTAWALDLRDPSRVLIARGAQILDLTNGVAGTLNPNNPTTAVIDAIAIDPTPSSKTLYIATHDGGVHRSVDGFNFSTYDGGLPFARAQFLWIDPAAPTVLRVGLQHLGLWRNN